MLVTILYPNNMLATMSLQEWELSMEGVTVTTGGAQRVAIQCATGMISIHTHQHLLGKIEHLLTCPMYCNVDSFSQLQ